MLAPRHTLGLTNATPTALLVYWASRCRTRRHCLNTWGCGTNRPTYTTQRANWGEDGTATNRGQVSWQPVTVIFSTRNSRLFQKRRENVCQNLNIETPETSYVDILQRLVRRYLFKLERQKLDNDGRYTNQLHSCTCPTSTCTQSITIVYNFKSFNMTCTERV